MTYFKTLLFLFFVPLTYKASAAIVMPSIFGDHMVLQRETKVALWGTANALFTGLWSIPMVKTVLPLQESRAEVLYYPASR